MEEKVEEEKLPANHANKRENQTEFDGDFISVDSRDSRASLF
jgi:hypothetical protein